MQDLQNSQAADEQSQQQRRMSQEISDLKQNTSSVREDLNAKIESTQEDSKKESACLDMRLNLAFAIIKELCNGAQEAKVFVRYILQDNEKVRKNTEFVQSKIRQRELDERKALVVCRPEMFNMTAANSRTSSLGSAGGQRSGSWEGSETSAGQCSSWQDVEIAHLQELTIPLTPATLRIATGPLPAQMPEQDLPINVTVSASDAPDTAAPKSLTVAASDAPDATSHDTRPAAGPVGVSFPWPAR